MAMIRVKLKPEFGLSMCVASTGKCMTLTAKPFEISKEDFDKFRSFLEVLRDKNVEDQSEKTYVKKDKTFGGAM